MSEGCARHGRLCTAQELAAGKGCAAGSAPVSDAAGDCAVAGTWAAEAEQLSDSAFVTVTTVFCRDSAAGPLRWCSAAEAQACATSQGSPLCVKAGLGIGPLYGGPKGFMSANDGIWNSGVAAVVPNPSDCGPPPYGTLDFDASTAVYVDSAKGDDAAAGTASAPKATIGAALAVAAPGATVAVAAGNYVESVEIAKPVWLRGRCAAEVTLTGMPGSKVIGHGKFSTPGQVHVSGLTVTGLGKGISISEGTPSFLFERIWLKSVQSFGFALNGAGVQVELRQVVVQEILPEPSGQFGMGLVIGKGAHVALHDVRIGGCKNTGVYVADPGTELTGDTVLVHDIDLQASDKQFGYGLNVQTGAHAQLTGVDVLMAAGTGARIADSGTVVALTQALVAPGVDMMAGTAGRGLMVQDGAHLTLTAARLQGTREIALAVQNPGAQVTANWLVIDHTQGRKSDDRYGSGITVAGGAALQLDHARLHANRYIGLAVVGAGTVADVAHTRIDATTVEQFGTDGLGWGMGVTAGAQAKLADVQLKGNYQSGLVVADPTTRVLAQRLEVTDTLPVEVTDAFGWGIVVHHGGRLQLDHARVVHNNQTGIAVQGEGSRLDALGVLVADTLPRQTDGKLGRGLAAQYGAEVRLSGCWLDRNADIGIDLAKAAASQLVGVAVTATRAQPNGQWGAGGYFTQGPAGVAVTASRFAGNHSAGLVVRQMAATVTGSAVVDTDTATYPTNIGAAAPRTLVSLADGIVLDQATGFAMTRSLVAGNSRAALLAKDAAAVTVGQSLLTGGFFGIAVAAGSTPQLVASVVRGSGQHIGGAAALFVPEPPALAPQAGPGP